MSTGTEFGVINRSIFSSFSSILRGGISLITTMLIARWLGPEDYGRMTFLLSTLIAFRELLNLHTAGAFFTFISQYKRSEKFISIFWAWILVQLILSILIIGFITPDNILNNIWLGEEKSLILLALLAVFFQHTVWLAAKSMADSVRETLKVQKLNIFIVFMHFVIIMLLWLVGQIALPAIFVAVAIEWVVAGYVAFRIYKDSPQVESESLKDNDTLTSIFNEFWQYCAPLIPYAWLSFAYLFLDRWMLQNWGGSIEQAYYALASQFGVIIILATTSTVHILWKEISEAHYCADLTRVEMLYKRSIHILFYIGAIMAGFLIPWVSEIIDFLLGSKYLDGVVTFGLMLIYAIHQTTGQISNMLLSATKETKLQAMIGVVFMITSLGVAYFVMAPSNSMLPGLNLASQGLAFKMVIMQIIQVNFLSWFIAKKFKWDFDWIFQVYILLSVITIGFLIKTAILLMIKSPIIALLIFCFFYFSLIGLLTYKFPIYSGIKKNEFKKLYLFISFKITKLWR